MGTKPAKHSRVERLTSSTHGPAMTSVRHLPQNYFSRVVGANPFGLRGGMLSSANPCIKKIGTRLPTTDLSGDASAKLTACVSAWVIAGAGLIGWLL